MFFSALAVAADPAVVLHLDATVRDLRQADASHLTVQARVRRASLLDALESYVAAGQVPQNHTEPIGHAAPVPVTEGMPYEHGRNPVFVDAEGTHCAVGYLLAVDGRDDLVRAAVERDNHGYLSELMSPALQSWAAESGFTVDELARIQPSYGWIEIARSRNDNIAAEIDAAGSCDPLWAADVKAVYDDFRTTSSLPRQILDCAVEHPEVPFMNELVVRTVSRGGAPEAACQHVAVLLPSLNGEMRELARRGLKACGLPEPTVHDEVSWARLPGRSATLTCEGGAPVELARGTTRAQVPLGVGCQVHLKGEGPALQVRAGEAISCVSTGFEARTHQVGGGSYVCTVVKKGS